LKVDNYSLDLVDYTNLAMELPIRSISMLHTESKVD